MTTTTTTTDAAQLVTAKTICLALKRGRFGNVKKASLAQVEVDADKTLLRLSKQLLDSPELKAIQKLDSEVQGYLRTVAFSSMFKGGVYLIPLAIVEQVEAALKNFAERRQVLVNAAVDAYPQRTQETSERLGVVHQPGDYPSAKRFEATFTFEWQYVTFDTPTRLKAISAALFEQEREKAAAKLSVVADECRDAMRAGLASMVDRLVERLTPDADGKPKKFTKTAVTNIHEFLASFELRNVTDDAELASVVEQARKVMAGVDVDMLRAKNGDNDSVRAAMLAQLTGVANMLQPMVVDRGARDISFDDED